MGHYDRILDQEEDLANALKERIIRAAFQVQSKNLSQQETLQLGEALDFVVAHTHDMALTVKQRMYLDIIANFWSTKEI